MYDVLIEPGCEVAGRSLRQADFRRRYGVNVLAIFRHGKPILRAIADIRLQVGDLLLVQAASDSLESLNRAFGVLVQLSPSLYQKKYGIFAVCVFVVTVIVGGPGWMPLSVAFLAAALLILLFRCIDIEKAYNFIDWRLLILIGNMTAFGMAMEKTGTAEFLAGSIIGILEPLGVFPIGARPVASGFGVSMLFSSPLFMTMEFASAVREAFFVRTLAHGIGLIRNFSLLD